MARRFVLILGGARSGKSDLAQKLALDMGGPVLFLATAQALDREMRQRIEAHQRSRPDGWRTLEEPLHLADALEAGAGDAAVVLAECVTLWVANVQAAASPRGVDEPDTTVAEAMLAGELGALHDWYRGSRASLILVSNEVGMGLVPPYPSGRAYRDLLGWANQRLATLATEVYLVVAGIPMELKSRAIHPWQQEELR
ncbi:MAG: bifunctional adenosylcobinamide kinase/adenosylcobinamide-phosphate guanylyltransferase [Chloroflexi bacterium]|nr:bifunctional adenosylcobinamide kinase/adenosylcobinamide-phosphate guanylyltransferase [Chloroflexota bacterium]